MHPSRLRMRDRTRGAEGQIDSEEPAGKEEKAVELQSPREKSIAPQALGSTPPNFEAALARAVLAAQRDELEDFSRLAPRSKYFHPAS